MSEGPSLLARFGDTAWFTLTLHAHNYTLYFLEPSSQVLEPQILLHVLKRHVGTSLPGQPSLFENWTPLRSRGNFILLPMPCYITS